MSAKIMQDRNSVPNEKLSPLKILGVENWSELEDYFYILKWGRFREDDEHFCPTITGLLCILAIAYWGAPQLIISWGFEYSLPIFFGLKEVPWKMFLANLILFSCLSVPFISLVAILTKGGFRRIRSYSIQLIVAKAITDFLFTATGGAFIWALLEKNHFYSNIHLGLILLAIFYWQALPVFRFTKASRWPAEYVS